MPENSGHELDVEDISTAEPVAVESPTSRKAEFFLQIGREAVRGSLAFGLLVLFGLTVWMGVKQIGTPSWTDAKEMLQILLPPESALLGSAIAFFFGGKGSG
jgi:hypothetical protein